MANYLEVKKVFCRMLDVSDINAINEDSNITFPLSRFDDGPKLVIDNEMLNAAFNILETQNCADMQLYSTTQYEVAVKSRWFPRGREITLKDEVNGIKYCLGKASLLYIVMVCNRMCEDEALMNEMIRSKPMVVPFLPSRDISVEDFIDRYFRINTIKIEADKETRLNTFVQFCNSFEYLYMYKTRRSVMKIANLSELYERSGGGRSRVGEIGEPPRRTVNPATLEYYAMAVNAEDPFTAYISFYHILEYYFDEVYKKKIVDDMKNKLTNPSFSYKNEKQIYELAKWIGKKMKNDDKDGRGNELDSLKYVLEEYVPIADLIKSLDEWNVGLKDYYQSKNVVFNGSSKGRIAWSDNMGVYTNISNRIYYTRNALVHSKSDQSDKQYKPQKHKSALVKELPLIQVIAELILFKDGEPL